MALSSIFSSHSNFIIIQARTDIYIYKKKKGKRKYGFQLFLFNNFSDNNYNRIDPVERENI